MHIVWYWFYLESKFTFICSAPILLLTLLRQRENVFALSFWRGSATYESKIGIVKGGLEKSDFTSQVKMCTQIVFERTQVRKGRRDTESKKKLFCCSFPFPFHLKNSLVAKKFCFAFVLPLPFVSFRSLAKWEAEKVSSLCVLRVTRICLRRLVCIFYKRYPYSAVLLTETFLYKLFNLSAISITPRKNTLNRSSGNSTGNFTATSFGLVRPFYLFNKKGR